MAKPEVFIQKSAHGRGRGALTHSASLPRRLKAFTLPELIVSVALGTMLLAGAVTFYGFSASSFVSMSNCVELTSQGRSASDLISRDIRTSTSVASATTNQMLLNALDGTNVAYVYDFAQGTLTRTKGGDTRILLTGLSSFSFSLYQRPNSFAPFEQFPAATPSKAKLVAFKWSSSRRVAGPRSDSQSVEMALVELRNQ